MRELVANARTIFLVSHALGTISDLCNDAIWMHQGELVSRGEPKDIVAAYTKFLKVGDLQAALEDL
jgi:ABC-type polysaccharide/polyol phosphate transport system ATPase subunit